MIRTVPNTGNEEIDLYMRTYYSLLRSSDAIKIQALVETHTAIDSSLHIHAPDPRIDLSAYIYAALRLPSILPQVNLVVMGQLPQDFARAGFGNVESWQLVTAPGRRRKMYFDGEHTLAVMIASRSDIDDIIPMLTALQIEWNKVHEGFRLHHALRKHFLDIDPDMVVLTQEKAEELAVLWQVETADVERLAIALGENFAIYLHHMAQHRLDVSLQLLASSQINYRKAASRWWNRLDHACQDCGTNISERPVYFVSSNTHSIANMLSGYAQEKAHDLQNHLLRLSQVNLMAEWESLQEEAPRNRANFLYYLLKKYQAAHLKAIDEQITREEAVGLQRISPAHGFDVEAQVLELGRLDITRLDPRLTEGLALDLLQYSDALVINIDYPLGLAAFELLTRVVEGCDQLLGIYIMGKAATLNGRIGDVMIANVVHDEHSKNTYLFNNCFQAHHLLPYLNYGMLLDNQKAITARGTFLQNRSFMDVFYKEGYTVIEMEAGPYLSAVYEMIRPTRHPYNEIVNLYPAPFDLGIVHYASDTPYSRGHNLGAGSLGYRGIDSTYATSIAIMRRVFHQETQRLAKAGHRALSTMPGG